MNNRYSRQELFPKIGKDGQAILLQKHVLIIGAGALGTGNAEALVRAGVGKMTIVDRDYVEWSNLQRQQLYSEEDALLQIPKAVAAKKRLQAINSEVEIIERVMDVSIVELEDLVRGVDLVIDGTDNFDTRFILNDMCQKMKIPWIYGACVGSYGLSYTIIPKKTPCLQCLMDAIPMYGATCDTAGIITTAVQMVVAQQVTEALKILTGNESSLRGTLLSFDLWENHYSSIKVDQLKKANCSSCGQSPIYPYLQQENKTKLAVLCGRDTVQIRPGNRKELSLEKLEQRLSKHGEIIQRNPYLLSLSIDPFRLVIFKDGRVLVHGTKNVLEAQKLYYQLLGS